MLLLRLVCRVLRPVELHLHAAAPHHRQGDLDLVRGLLALGGDLEDRAARGGERAPDLDEVRVVDLIRRMRDMILLTQVEDHLRLVRYAPGRIEFQPTPDAPRDLASRLGERLRGWTGGARWAVSIVDQGGAETISEQKARERSAAEARAMENPVIAAIFAAAPGARITAIRDETPPPPADEGAADPHATAEGGLAEAEEWDPFEDEE